MSKLSVKICKHTFTQRIIAWWAMSLLELTTKLGCWYVSNGILRNLPFKSMANEDDNNGDDDDDDDNDDMMMMMMMMMMIVYFPQNYAWYLHHWHNNTLSHALAISCSVSCWISCKHLLSKKKWLLCQILLLVKSITGSIICQHCFQRRRGEAIETGDES